MDDDELREALAENRRAHTAREGTEE